MALGPIVTRLLELSDGDTTPDGTTLLHLRLALAEARIWRDRAEQDMARAERAAVDLLLNSTEGGERGLGPNEAARKRAIENAVADDPDYATAAAAWTDWTERHARLEARVEVAQDQRREEDRRVREKLADALLVSAGVAAASPSEAFVSIVAGRVAELLAHQIGAGPAPAPEPRDALI